MVFGPTSLCSFTSTSLKGSCQTRCNSLSEPDLKLSTVSKIIRPIVTLAQVLVLEISGMCLNMTSSGPA